MILLSFFLDLMVASGSVERRGLDYDEAERGLLRRSPRRLIISGRRIASVRDGDGTEERSQRNGMRRVGGGGDPVSATRTGTAGASAWFRLGCTGFHPRPV